MRRRVLSGALLAVLFTLLSPARLPLTSLPHRRHPDLRAVASRSPASRRRAAAWAAKTVDSVPGAEAAEAYYDAFAALAADPSFAVDAWARAPLLISDPLPGVADSFTLADVEEVVEADFLDAGKGVADGPAGWQMAPVSLPRGNAFEDAKMRWIDVRAALDDGTVVFNSAGGLIPKLAAFSLAALDAFELPNCLNLYLTGRGVATSAPPHTDKQDVFVLQARAIRNSAAQFSGAQFSVRNSGPTRVYHPLQTCGAKHWRVFAPPDPSRKPAADPLARGKAADALTLSELGEPLIDTVLTPGQLLYMPAGFPHTTDTLNLGEPAPPAAADDSVHLTIGIDTHIWGLDYLGARAGALKRAALPDQCTATKLPEEAHWKLMGIPPHLGFLRRHAAAHAAADPDATAEDAAAAAAAPSWWRRRARRSRRAGRSTTTPRSPRCSTRRRWRRSS